VPCGRWTAAVRRPGDGDGPTGSDELLPSAPHRPLSAQRLGGVRCYAACYPALHRRTFVEPPLPTSESRAPRYADDVLVISTDHRKSYPPLPRQRPVDDSARPQSIRGTDRNNSANEETVDSWAAAMQEISTGVRILAVALQATDGRDRSVIKTHSSTRAHVQHIQRATLCAPR